MVFKIFSTTLELSHSGFPPGAVVGPVAFLAADGARHEVGRVEVAPVRAAGKPGRSVTIFGTHGPVKEKYTLQKII
jgi:hypothetical protein